MGIKMTHERLKRLQRDGQRRLRAHRRAAGLCPGCGGKPASGRILCPAHLAKSRQRWHALPTWKQQEASRRPLRRCSVCDTALVRGRHDPCTACAFWTKVEKRDVSACWPWKGSVMGEGYGRYRQAYTHRLAWMLANGPIPAGLFVLHKCDNPPCCNPDHLFLGTQADNVRDRDAKGRHWVPSGERHPCAKLN